MSNEDFADWARAATPSLTRIGFLLTGDHHLAQDLTQEALARVHLRWKRLADQQPDAYARRIMVNQLTSWRRRRSWRETAAAQPATDAETRGFEYDAAQRVSLIPVLRQLPPQQRAAVVLRFYDDLDDDAIAGALGCAPGTVRVHLRKAMATLRNHPIPNDLTNRSTTT